MPQWIFILPTGSAAVKGSRSLAMPTHVYRLVAALPPGAATVLDMPMRYGIPLDEAGAAKVQAALQADLDAALVPGQTIVGFSCTASADIVFALPLARWIKERYGCPILLGGYAPSTCYELLLRHYGPWIDGVVVGAGELAAPAALAALSEGRLDHQRIPGLAWLRDGALVLNDRLRPPRACDLPPLDISTLARRESYPYIAYNASVGCPYTCAFCPERRVHPRYDARPADLALRDLAGLVQSSGLRYVGFHDPIFGVQPDTRALLEGINALGLEYILQTRVDAFDRRWYPLLAQGCRFIFWGLEGVSVTSLMRMHKAPDAARYLGAVEDQMRACFEAGILPVISLLPNYPLNTLDDAEATLRFAEHLREVYERVGGRGGLAFTPFQFRMEYGSPSQAELPQLRAQGLTARPYFPPEYHGVPLPEELMLVVEDASADLPLAEFRRTARRIQALSVLTPERLATFSRYYVIDLDPFLEGKLPEAHFYTDPARDVVHAPGLVAHLGEYTRALMGGK